MKNLIPKRKLLIKPCTAENEVANEIISQSVWPVHTHTQGARRGCKSAVGMMGEFSSHPRADTERPWM